MYKMFKNLRTISIECHLRFKAHAQRRDPIFWLLKKFISESVTFRTLKLRNCVPTERSSQTNARPAATFVCVNNITLVAQADISIMCVRQRELNYSLYAVCLLNRLWLTYRDAVEVTVRCNWLIKSYGTYVVLRIKYISRCPSPRAFSSAKWIMLMYLYISCTTCTYIVDGYD